MPWRVEEKIGGYAVAWHDEDGEGIRIGEFLGKDATRSTEGGRMQIAARALGTHSPNRRGEMVVVVDAESGDRGPPGETPPEPGGVDLPNLLGKLRDPNGRLTRSDRLLIATEIERLSKLVTGGK